MGVVGLCLGLMDSLLSGVFILTRTLVDTRSFAILGSKGLRIISKQILVSEARPATPRCMERGDGDVPENILLLYGGTAPLKAP